MIWTIRTAGSARSWPTGSRRWPGCPSALQLPTDRPYPAVADYRGASLTVEWPAELQQRVARVAREHNATSFMVIQAALAVLLAKLSASTRGGRGVRDRRARVTPRWMSWSGFSSTRWCCGWIWPGIPPSPRCWPRCEERSLAAFEHQDVPFEVLVERLNPTRSLAHHPLVQVMLAWQNLPGTTRPAAGLALGDLQVSAAAGGHPHRPDGFDVFVGRTLHRGW